MHRLPGAARPRAGCARELPRRLTALATAVALLAAGAAPAVEIDQVDDFTGSLQGWQRGTLAAPGWDGPGDQYLQLSADGGSQNGSLVTFNQAQWAGDYLAENVVAIAIDVNNFSAETLHRRLALGDGIAPRLGGTWYASDLPIDLPPGSGWMEAV